MPNITERVADNAIEHAIEIERVSASVRADIRHILRKCSFDIERLIDESNPSEPRARRFRQDRQDQLLRDIRRCLVRTYSRINSQVRRDLNDIGEVESEAALSIINTALAFALLTSRQTQQDVRELVRTVEVEGAPALTWFNRQRDLITERIDDQVNIGVSLREDTESIKERVLGRRTRQRQLYIDPDTGERSSVALLVGGAFFAAYRYGDSLIRSLINAATQVVSFDAYARNANVVRGLQALAVLDNRTSQICQSRSGNAWTIQGQPIPPTREPFPGRPPWHFGCRSQLIPVLFNKNRLLSNLRGTRRQQIQNIDEALLTGGVAGDIRYETWLRGRPASFQREVLGPTKYRLWRQGRVNFSDLVDQRGNPLSVAELKARYF